MKRSVPNVFLTVFIGAILLGFFQVIACAADVNQQLDQVGEFLKKGDEKSAVDLLQRIYKEYPENPTAALNLGFYYTQKKNYLNSVGYYEESLRRFPKFSSLSSSDVITNMASVHQDLVSDYNELGQQRYFSAELCLRILYHLEQSFQLSDSISKDMEKPETVEFTRKTIGHYDVAKRSPNVRMMEWNPKEGKPLAAFKQETELVLPSDGIPEQEKLKTVETITARIRALDDTHPAYQRVPSDLSLDAVLGKMESSFQSVQTAHCVKRGIHELTVGKLIEELWYQSPATLKTHVELEGRSQEWWILRSGEATSFDPKTRVFSREAMPGIEQDWLMNLRKPNPSFLRQRYNLSVQKLTEVPSFLSELYKGRPSPALYLLTAEPKSPEESWPPVIREEFIVDLEHGLLVGFRKYWRGVIGSWRDEELATTDVVTQWKQFPGSLFLPESGWTEQLVDEITDQDPAHRVVRAPWQVEIITVNAPINSSEFDLEGYATESTGSTEAIPPRS